MASGSSEGFQYKFEVQEATEGTDGEVIIIYNYDGEEITPEILAKTLEELSTHLSLQRVAQIQPQVSAKQENSVACLPCVDDFSLQLDADTLNVPIIKVEVAGTEGNESVAEGKNDTIKHISAVCNNSEIFISNGIEDGCDKDALTHFENILFKVNEDFKENVSQEADSIEQTEMQNVDNSIPLQEVEQTAVNKKISTLPMVSFSNVTVKQDILSEEEEGLSNFSCDKCMFICQKEKDYQRHQKQEHKEKNPFICRHCGKAFQLELSLSIHKLGHSQNVFDSKYIFNVMKHFTCPLCDFQYQRKRQLNAHIRSQHNNKVYLLCSKCNYSCLTEDELEKHVASAAHDEAGRINCPLCGKATKDIKQHLRRTHNDSRPFLCTQCGFKAKTVTHLNTHMVIHDPVKRVQCDLCDYKCRTKDQLKKHMVKHSVEKDFKCKLCAFACKTGMSLKRHMQIHKTPNKYVCNICQFTTHDKIILRQHKAQEHILKASYKCRQCELQFDRIIELKKHALAEHKSEKTQFCSYCDFAGQTPAELRTHMQTHFGKFSYSCSVCGYMCRLKASYQRHIERHTKVKKFMCTLCSYASVEKYDLQKHYVHRHSEDKPLSCPYCSYRCKFKPRLDNHISYVHTDVKPFFCKLCPYTGKSAENLKKHMVNHGLVQKTLQCVLCDYATAEKAKLKRHMQVHVKKAIFQCRKVAF